tara:strand:+ start:199 stop:378 length:180 start_codon:yes stop_codon:yes gene_type:complete
MGAYGATKNGTNRGVDVIDYNKEKDYSVSSAGHSDVFKTPLLSYFGPKIIQTMKKRIGL